MPYCQNLGGTFQEFYFMFFMQSQDAPTKKSLTLQISMFIIKTQQAMQFHIANQSTTSNHTPYINLVKPHKAGPPKNHKT
jgi:hypothetical protein